MTNHFRCRISYRYWNITDWYYYINAFTATDNYRRPCASAISDYSQPVFYLLT